MNEITTALPITRRKDKGVYIFFFIVQNTCYTVSSTADT